VRQYGGILKSMRSKNLSTTKHYVICAIYPRF